MAVNMSTSLYSPCQDVFGRSANFTSKTGNSFNGSGRGIYSSTEINVPLDDGSIITDQQTILDIRTAEFPTLPVQDDTVALPYDPISGVPDLGSFQIVNAWHNGGGEMSLQLRRLVIA